MKASDWIKFQKKKGRVMKKVRILGVSVPMAIIVAVLVVVLGSGVAMAAVVYSVPIGSGSNLTVQEPFAINGSLDPVPVKAFFPGQDVTSGTFSIENKSPVAYGVLISAQNNSQEYSSPILAVGSEVTRKTGVAEKVSPYQSILIGPGENISVRAYVFLPHYSPAGTVVTPKLVFERVEPPSFQQSGKG